jgi:periplasmic protein TonB
MSDRDASAAPTRRSDALACWLVGCAARRAPLPLRERLQEEWLADLASRQGTAARLRLAIGCCWATQVIAFEHAAVRVSVPAAAAAPDVLRAQPHSWIFPRRMVALLLIASLHIAVIYSLATGLWQKIIPDAQTITVANVTTEVPVQQRPVPPGPPDLAPVQVERPTATELAPDVIQENMVDPPPAQPPQSLLPTAPPAVHRVVGGLGQGFPSTGDYYPPASRRAGEQGVATIEVCVNGAGRLMGLPQVSRSSGSARLDEGALGLARAASGHYRPTTEDGRPVDSCYPLVVRFALD